MTEFINNPEPETETKPGTGTQTKVHEFRVIVCPSCGEAIQIQVPADNQAGEIVHGLLSGLPAGVKFDPTDQEILEHLEAKVLSESDIDGKLHPLIDKFIATLDSPGGICYTHPENLPGVSKDGQVRHFFHRPSKAYTMGSRKRRRVEGNHEDGIETRWHKTGKTRPIFSAGVAKGFKKILVLYTNYGRRRKPHKTNWVMHQYHTGGREEEEDGQLVLSKVFYQKQTNKKRVRTRSGSAIVSNVGVSDGQGHPMQEFYGRPSFICYDELGKISTQVGVVPYFGGEGRASIASDTSKSKGIGLGL